MPSRVSWLWKQGMILAVLLLGDGAMATPGEPPPTNSGQGAKLHGTGRFEHVNIRLASAKLPDGSLWESFGIEQGNLKGKSGGREYTGPGLANKAVFSAPFDGQTVEFEITAAGRHWPIPSPSRLPPLTGLWEFKVTWKLSDGTPGDLCPTGNGFALAVPHAWSASGELLDNPLYFTFACVPKRKAGDPKEETKEYFIGGGAIAKCIDWGYPPWDSQIAVGLAARKLHQVCVRLATADYCGEGEANTLDGTPITLLPIDLDPRVRLALRAPKAPRAPRDLEHPERLAATVSVDTNRDGHPEDTKYNLEAVWGIDKCGQVRTLCLGKLRWASLTPDGTCLDLRTREKLMNLTGVPFLDPQHKGPEIVPCEDWTIDRLRSSGARLVSYSTFLDKRLVRFQNDDTGSALTTSFVAWSSNPDMEGSVRFKPYSGPPASIIPRYSEIMAEGPILSPNLPPALKEGLMERLKLLYRCKGSYLLTTSSSDCPEGSDDEGYILASGPGSGLPLYRWNLPGGKIITSTKVPLEAISPTGDLLGFLPALDQLTHQNP